MDPLKKALHFLYIQGCNGNIVHKNLEPGI